MAEWEFELQLKTVYTIEHLHDIVCDFSIRGSCITVIKKNIPLLFKNCLFNSNSLYLSVSLVALCVKS